MVVGVECCLGGLVVCLLVCCSVPCTDFVNLQPHKWPHVFMQLKPPLGFIMGDLMKIRISTKGNLRLDTVGLSVGEKLEIRTLFVICD